jgi:UDP-glucose 4-epimerase
MKRTQSNIVVTGSAGFMGSDLVRKLKARGHAVTGVDNMLLGSDQETTDFVEDAADLEIMKQVMHQVKPEIMFLLAAVPCESFSAFAPGLITYNTYQTTVASLTAAIDAGIKRVIYISSMAVYGHGDPPFDETQTPTPEDIYGIAKYAGEMTVQNLCQAYDIEWVILRPHNVYGPGQRLDDALRNVVGIFLNRVMRKMPMPVYGDGLQERSFSYIDDVTSSIISSGFKEGISGQIINIGSDQPTTILQLAKVIGKVTGFAEIEHEEARREVKMATTTNTKAKELLGSKDSVNLEEGIRRMYLWAREQGPQAPIYLTPELNPTWLPKTWSQKNM